MGDLSRLKHIIHNSFLDFKEYFSFSDFNLYLLLFVDFIIEISRMKYMVDATMASKVVFEIGTYLLMLPLSSMVLVDIILIRKARDLNAPKESVFNNTLTFILTSLVTIVLTALGFVFLVIPGIFLFVALSMAPFIAVYEEGEGMTPLRRSFELIGKQKFLLIAGGLLFLGIIQFIAGNIPYSSNLYVSFFIGILKAIFFPINVIFSSFMMFNLYEHLREVQLSKMIDSEEYV